VGLLATIGKALKINGRFRRYVVQDYRTSVTSATTNRRSCPAAFFVAHGLCRLLYDRHVGPIQIWVVLSYVVYL